MVLHGFRRLCCIREPFGVALPTHTHSVTHIRRKVTSARGRSHKAPLAGVSKLKRTSGMRKSVSEPPEIDIAAPTVAKYQQTKHSEKESLNFPHFHAHEQAVTAKLREMIAVDLAGETAAVRICNTHLRFFPNDPVVEEILFEERNHVDIMEEWASKLGVPVSALDPVFHGASLLMGGFTALLGKKAVMCCHAAIEEVITAHYNDQLREIVALESAVSSPASAKDATPPASEAQPKLRELRKTVKQLRDEEQHHHELGIDHGGRDFIGSSILYNAVKCACKVGIFLAKRF